MIKEILCITLAYRRADQPCKPVVSNVGLARTLLAGGHWCGDVTIQTPGMSLMASSQLQKAQDTSAGEQWPLLWGFGRWAGTKRACSSRFRGVVTESCNRMHMCVFSLYQQRHNARPHPIDQAAALRTRGALEGVP